MRPQAVAAPSKSDVGNVTNVALKDVPLRSLFPEDPAPPRAVRLPASAAVPPCRLPAVVSLPCAAVSFCRCITDAAAVTVASTSGFFVCARRPLHVRPTPRLI